MSDQPAPAPVASEEALALEHAAIDREQQEMFGLKLALPGWLQGNPGLALTALYLFASVVGMVFHYRFLSRFGFNVLEFSETSDFLMVLVREPLTVAMALLGVPFYLAYGAVTDRVGRWARQNLAMLRYSPEQRRASLAKMQRWWALIQFSFIAVWAMAFVTFYSQWRAMRIRDGNFTKVAVHYKTDSPVADGGLVATDLALLGTTSRFLFLYNPVTKKADVVPHDAVARLVWDARSRRERALE